MYTQFQVIRQFLKIIIIFVTICNIFDDLYDIISIKEGITMNFNLQKFSADVKEFRNANKLTQSEFAAKLELDNHTLVSLFEQGKRAPSKEVFANYCRITGHRSEEYWEATNDMPSAYLMGKIQEADKKALESALKKIGMREYLFALYDRVKK